MENLNKKFDELSSYFKEQIVKGNYDIIDIDEMKLVVKVLVGNKYTFHLWASLISGYEYFGLYEGFNAMFFDFTEDEKYIAHQEVIYKVEKL